MKEQNEKSAKKVNKKLVIIGVLIVIIAALCVGGYFLLNKSGGQKIDSNAKKFEVKVERPKDMKKDQIAIPGYADIHVENGSDEINVALFNPNGNPCYFKFTVMIDEGKEVIFESGLIPPGEAVTKSKLNKKMTTGTYPITIKIDTYDLDDRKTEMNGSQVKTNIVVE